MSLNIEQPERQSERTLDNKSTNAGSDKPFDLVAVGFGTTSLSLAASLADKSPKARILFVEREKQFTWPLEHVLPDKPIGTSFLRDLTTTQNPRSAFTFMNFLHATNQLIRFANNSKLEPTRRLMGWYFRWAADRISQLGWVRYGQEAVRVKPIKISALNRVTRWEVELQDASTGAVSVVQAKRIVLATGATPHILPALAGPQLEPLVLHSSSSTGLLEKLGNLKQTLNIAIVGADQEATELFNHLHTARGKHTATMFFADSALRPDDHTPSIPDMLERPESMPGTLPPEVRQRLHSGGAHQSPKVHLHTLESLYEAQYTQKISQPDPSKWRFQMRPLSEVVAAKRQGDKVHLVTRNPRTGEVATSATAFDVVISATGYEFVTNMNLVGPVTPLLDAGALTVDKEYRVNFRRDALVRGCGMWLLGSLEDLKERGDNFKLMAERARRAAQSVLAQMDEKAEELYGEVAVL